MTSTPLASSRRLNYHEFMKKHHERRPARVAEPVQVYLERPDREILERLSGRLGATKSDVLRRGLAALERQLEDPAYDPVLRIIGVADAMPEGRDPGYDVAREHDRFLAEHGDAAPRKGRRGRGG